MFGFFTAIALDVILLSFSIAALSSFGKESYLSLVIMATREKSLGKRFSFPPPSHSKVGGLTLEGQKTRKWVTLKEAIGNLPKPRAALDKNKAHEKLRIPNHEFMNGSFSTIYMSRNRKKCWGDQSFTIQAGGRHAPLHPSSTEMMKVGEDEWTFKDPNPKYRRLSVRECARIQTFPDDFVFYYKNVADGYKMIGNAVPVKLAEAIARKIFADLSHAREIVAPSLQATADKVM